MEISTIGLDITYFRFMALMGMVKLFFADS
jgi:hypothetical protein